MFIFKEWKLLCFDLPKEKRGEFIHRSVQHFVNRAWWSKEKEKKTQNKPGSSILVLSPFVWHNQILMLVSWPPYYISEIDTKITDIQCFTKFSALHFWRFFCLSNLYWHDLWWMKRILSAKFLLLSTLNINFIYYRTWNKSFRAI